MSKDKEVAQKKTKEKDKNKVGFWKKLGKGFSNMFVELKKVSWPKFGNVIKQTGVVLGVVLIFLVVVTAFDFGLGQLLKLLTSQAG